MWWKELERELLYIYIFLKKREKSNKKKEYWLFTDLPVKIG